MKKNYVFGLGALIVLALSVVTFISCQKSQVSDLVSSTELSSGEKLEVKSLFPLTGEMGLLPSQDKMSVFENLNDEQLDYFFSLQANERAPLEGRSDDGLSRQDVVSLFEAQLSAIDDLAVSLLNKRYNQLSEKEVGDLLVDHILEVIRIMKEKVSSSSALKFLDQYEKGVKDATLKAESFSEATLSLRSGCPKYYYGIRTYIADSGSRSCRGYVRATNLSDNDCDCEFIFDWPYNYSPSYQLGLYSSGWNTSQILKMGGVNGRISEGGDSTVRFLIGKKRIYACLTTPDGVKNNLKGDWGVIV